MATTKKLSAMTEAELESQKHAIESLLNEKRVGKDKVWETAEGKKIKALVKEVDVGLTICAKKTINLTIELDAEFVRGGDYATVADANVIVKVTGTSRAFARQLEECFESSIDGLLYDDREGFLEMLGKLKEHDVYQSKCLKVQEFADKHGVDIDVIN